MQIQIARIKAQRFACLSFAISIAEMLVVWGGVAIAFALPHGNWHWMGRLFETVLLAGLSSIVFALVGLFRDPERILAFLALVSGVLVAGICSVPLSG